MMRKLFGTVLVLFVLVSFAAAQGHEYIELNKCVMCHKGERKGNIYETWQETGHAKAYETLGTEKAKQVAAEMGIENPQEADQCLKCHVTGYAEGSVPAGVEMANGVSCQACHGPGSDYKSMSVMKDREQAIAAGLVANPKENCTTCHNEESPTYKPFSIEEFWPKVEHSTPE